MGGSASADAAASSGVGGQVQADASAFSGELKGGASASATAQNRSGETLTTASAPGDPLTVFFPGASSPSALSTAAVDSGSVTLALTPGRTVSNAILTQNGSDIGVGAMSAAYGGAHQSLDYSATAVFDFTTSTSEALDLKLLSDTYNFVENSAGIAFDNLDLQVIVGDGTPAHTISPASPARAALKSLSTRI